MFLNTARSNLFPYAWQLKGGLIKMLILRPSQNKLSLWNTSSLATSARSQIRAKSRAYQLQRWLLGCLRSRQGDKPSSLYTISSRAVLQRAEHTPFSKCPCCHHCHLDQMDFSPEWRCFFRKSFVSLFAIQPSAAPSHGQQRQIVKSLPHSLSPPRSPHRYPHSPPLRSNISVVQSIALDRQLLELELGRLVTDNMACLFNFVSCNGVALKWLTINHHGCVHHVACQCHGEWQEQRACAREQALVCVWEESATPKEMEERTWIGRVRKWRALAHLKKCEILHWCWNVSAWSPRGRSYDGMGALMRQKR